MDSVPGILHRNKPDRRTVDCWTIDMAATFRIGLNGAIVSDCPPECPDMDSDAEKHYGGHFVCESVTGSLAKFIVDAAHLAAAVKDLVVRP